MNSTLKNPILFFKRPAGKAILLIAVGLIFLPYCDLQNEDETEPIVSIISPEPDTEFDEGDPISIEIEASDNRELKSVSLSINDQLLKTFTGPPLTYNWQTTGNMGTQKITASATDVSGNEGFSDISVYLRRIISFDQSSVVAVADDRGKVKIESNIESDGNTYELTFDFTITDELGGPVPGAEVTYSQINGKCLIYIYDPNGEHTCGLIIGTPEELKDKLDGIGIKSADFSVDYSDEVIEESSIIALTIAAVLAIGAIAYAEVNAIINMYKIQTFYLTDYVEEGEDYILYCKTFEEIAELIHNQTELVLNLSSIVISFVTLGGGGMPNSVACEIVKGVGWPTVETLRNGLVEQAIDEWGVAMSELTGNKKYGYKVFTYDEDGSYQGAGYIFVVREIIKDEPLCSSEGNVIQGTVTDAATGYPIEGVLVQIRSGNTLINNDFTDQDGQYFFMNTEPGNYSITTSKSGYIEETKTFYHDGIATQVNFVLSEELGSSEVRFVLSWGEYPLDLDLHLFTSDGYHIYWNKKGSEDQYPYIFLDVDDRSSYGPETITMKQLQSSKVTVHNFSGEYAFDEDIKQSDAIVTIYQGSSKVAEYPVPSSGTGYIWEVCNISGTGAISPINILTNSDPNDDYKKK